MWIAPPCTELYGLRDHLISHQQQTLNKLNPIVQELMIDIQILI